ncbi:hypothetical protein KDW_39960 [Dictyobacter vulcani]|uniref:Uncharacterized protein n=1 Tax=Dictyobacter vulcani TaxID=2607529 RepID=A0A5J4KK13_9CHLR|nr:hypothetical protein [Dictyobacter vulcani]GER89834.1 hypothetical protein KDW_39960 [Dictyobacter vulcani]
MHKLFARIIPPLASALVLLIGGVEPALAANSSVTSSQHAIIASHHTLAPLSGTYHVTPVLTNHGNPGWAYFTDYDGVPSAYTDSNGNVQTSSAVWHIPSGIDTRSCDFSVYVPTPNGTANISYGFYNGSTRVAVINVDQNLYQPTDPWVYLTSGRTITAVQFSNNNGQKGTRIGVGQYNSLELDCAGLPPKTPK